MPDPHGADNWIALLNEAARYIDASAEGEGDHYRRRDYAKPLAPGDDPNWAPIVGYGPRGQELAAQLRLLAVALAETALELPTRQVVQK